jgi:hypothetical protein
MGEVEKSTKRGFNFTISYIWVGIMIIANYSTSQSYMFHVMEQDKM